MGGVDGGESVDQIADAFLGGQAAGDADHNLAGFGFGRAVKGSDVDAVLHGGDFFGWCDFLAQSRLAMVFADGNDEIAGACGEAFEGDVAALNPTRLGIAKRESVGVMNDVRSAGGAGGQTSEESAFGGMSGHQVEFLAPAQTPQLDERQDVQRIDGMKPEGRAHGPAAGFGKAALDFVVQAEHPDFITTADHRGEIVEHDDAASAPRSSG